MSLPDAVRRTVERFAEQIGVSARAATDGRYAFQFSRSGLLGIEADDGGERVLVSLTRALPRAGEAIEARLLALAGPDLAGEQMLHAGLTGADEAIFALSIPVAKFALPTLEAGLGRLIAAQDALG